MVGTAQERLCPPYDVSKLREFVIASWDRR
jgi:hypothetical protein